MDYVLFGMGYGATLMLLGWALRTFGPERKYKDVDESDVDRIVLKRRWIRFIQGLGGVVSIAGTALVVFTFVVMLVNPTDDTGAFISLAISGFIAVAILIWCWFYVSNFGVTGVWSRKSGYRSEPVVISGRGLAQSSTRVVPKPRIQDRDGAPDIGPSLVESESIEPLPVDSTDSGEIGSSDENAPGVEAVPSQAGEDPQKVNAEEIDPEYDFGDSADTTVPSEIGGRTEAIRRLRERQAKSGDSTN